MKHVEILFELYKLIMCSTGDIFIESICHVQRGLTFGLTGARGKDSETKQLHHTEDTGQACQTGRD